MEEIVNADDKSNWKMTDDVVGKLEYAFAIDCNITEACAYADISRDTYYEWIQRFPLLSDRFEQLRNNPVLLAKDCVTKGVRKDPDLALRYLKLKRPKEFSEVVQIESKNLHIHLIEELGKIGNEDET